MATHTTEMYYQRIVRHLRRSGRMCPEEASEQDFQTALEFDLRRAGIPFVSQPQFPTGRPDLLVGSFAIELKVDHGETMTIASVADQAEKYLSEASESIQSVVVGILHTRSRQVHIHQVTRDNGVQLVLSRSKVSPRQSHKSLELAIPDGPSDFSDLRDPMSEADYQAIKEALAAKPRQYPYLLIVQVLRNTGLRQAEVLRVTPQHLERSGPIVYILVQRGKKRGVPRWERMPVRPELGAMLLAYVQGNPSDPSRRIWPFTARSLQRVFLTASYTALGRRLTVHQLRHLYLNTLRKAGVSVEDAADLVGHEDTRTTRKHYYELSLEDRYEAARWMPM